MRVLVRRLALTAIVLASSISMASFAFAEHRSGSGHSHQCGHHGKHKGQYQGKHKSKHHGCGKKHGMRAHGGGSGHGAGWRGGKRVDRLLERFDANKDGELTQSELDASRTELVEKYDTDKDGKLSLSEFERLWLDVKRRRMVRGFQYIDEDGDALITVEEFLKPYSDTVERMDRDGDGSISRDDRRGKKRRGGRHAPADQQEGATPEAERK